jgi:cell division protein ZapA
MIKQFEQSYAVRDKQDVLAMCALQFAAQVEQKQISKSQDNETNITRLQNLDKKLSELLSK